jgi:PDZ domain-containing protein
MVIEAPRNRWWAWLLAGLGFLVLAVVSISSLIPATVVAERFNERVGEYQETPYAQIPASAEPVNDRVVFGDLPDDVNRFEPDGDFYFVTVSAPKQSLLSWFAGRDDPAVQFLTFEDKYGTSTPTQRREINLQAMRTAEQEAQYLALTRAGYDAEISPGEVIVQATLCRTYDEDGSCAEMFPSDEQIDPADRILEADGEELGSVEDLAAVLEDKRPGDTVELLVDRPGDGEMTVTVELAEAPDEPGRTIIGFRPFDTRVVTLPFEVDIETNSIGGPSAGLAFTLALIDELTEGELACADQIAVTGTIGLDGTVGPIGGLAQKVSAVHQNGVDTFLVPAGQPEFDDPEQVRRLEDAGRGEVAIIPVATLDEALQVLEDDLGCDPLVPVDAAEGPDDDS